MPTPGLLGLDARPWGWDPHIGGIGIQTQFKPWEASVLQESPLSSGLMIRVKWGPSAAARLLPRSPQLD